MLPHTRQLLSTIGKDHHFEIICERNVLCWNFHAIKGVGLHLFTPRLDKKFRWDFAQIFRLLFAQPSHLEMQILNRLRRRGSVGLPIADLRGTKRVMQSDFQNNIARVRGNGLAILAKLSSP